MLIECSNFGPERTVRDGNSFAPVRDLRKLGCPDWLAARVERRAEEKRAKQFGDTAIVPPHVIEETTLAATAAAIKAL